MTACILIVDDHEMVRRGLRTLLEPAIPAVCEEAVSAGEALDRIAAGSFDLVILDLNLPGLGGLDILPDLCQIKPDLPVLVFSQHLETQLGPRCLRLGARGYLPKSSDAVTIVDAVRTLLRGERHATPALLEQMRKDLRPVHHLLSEREFEVFRLIGAGIGTGEIARRLGVKPRTVGTFRDRILGKTGFSGNAEIVRYCLNEGLSS
jgi:DNA-binding NarL/FixJ family response regulator